MERGNEPPAVNNKAPSLGSEGREELASEVEPPANVAETKKTESHASRLPNVGKKNVVVKPAPADSRAMIAPQDDVYVAPKLVKAIRSLSPPEALRAYVSGVVTLDTVVDETGRVQSATPVSGPKALYKKAEETVKDYVYQPATRNAKPVPAHVEVKIQFWYEP
jgi:outer membrane biosynthesis protein TonB